MPAGALLFHPCIGPRSGAPALDTGPQAEAGAVRMAPARRAFRLTCQFDCREEKCLVGWDAQDGFAIGL